jgi:hypothetical protein
MKHPSTKAVYGYWTLKRGNRSAPARAQIDPADIRHALGDTFMLAADFADQLRFRLAGTRVCALFGREIKGDAVIDLWNEASRADVDELLVFSITEMTGAVAGVTGRTENGDAIDMEMLVLPLDHNGETRIRALGVLAPLAPPYWLGAKPVVELELDVVRHLGADTGSDTALVPEPSRIQMRHGFVVYTGGRHSPFSKRGRLTGR